MGINRELIAKLFTEEMKTQTEIGEIFGISKERVRVILNSLFNKETKREITLRNIRHKVKNNPRVKPISYTCKNCGKVFDAKYYSRTFCEIKCQDEYRDKNRLSDEEKKHRQSLAMKKYYLNKRKAK